MQTFLPFPDYAESASVLDDRRLGKQRVENLQILGALLEGRGWTNHPATKMWRSYEWSLVMYQDAIHHEWVNLRKFTDTCMEKTVNLYFKHRIEPEPDREPWWLGDWAFHFSHQSNLVRKDPIYYTPYFPDVPDDIEYVWPV
jgi:hypothetical protein